MVELAARGAGILLHPASLVDEGEGVLAGPARRFLRLLASAGQSWWQVLPLNPPGFGGSPYAARSAFAGDVSFVGGVEPIGQGEREAFEAFQERNRAWLDDWTLFESIRKAENERPWWEWPAGLRTRDDAALGEAARRLADEITGEELGQWRFEQAWAGVRREAAALGIGVIGDLPIFVDHNSADVWANQHLFKLDGAGMPLVVAGVPPDYFSATGQRWGNPVYRWEVVADDGYRWWIERMRRAAHLYDIVRIDHFRGFAAAWEIPSDQPTAIVGEWVPGPGRELFQILHSELGSLPVIAEDLGVITEDVVELRDSLGIPGMAILQFAFGGDVTSGFLPHNLRRSTVLYTGTHDNDTTAGWLEALSDEERLFLMRYLDRAEPSVDDMIRLAYGTVAATVVVPMQDVLGLGTASRMNFPGTTVGNWQWKLDWSLVREGRMEWLRDMAKLYGRVAE